jgi:predicted nucleic acid-binding protein
MLIEEVNKNHHLRFNRSYAIAYIISSNEYQWLVSSEIMDEYKNVLNRPKFRLSETQKRESPILNFS